MHHQAKVQAISVERKLEHTLTLREHLRAADNELYTRFRNFEIEATKLLEYSQAGQHLSFTTHGISHIAAVERNYQWLLSPNDLADFTAAEAFVLLCATYSHDLFMIPKQPGDEARARSTHATSAGVNLAKLQSDLGISSSDAYMIGEVVRAHHVQSISEIHEDMMMGAERVRLRMLGACLSMADICHADQSRAPSIVFKYLELEEESAWHWKRHMQITGIGRSESAITVSSLAFSEEGEKAVQAYAQEIRDQLERIKPYFASKLQTIDQVLPDIRILDSEFEQDLSFQTDTSSVIELLVQGLYRRSDVFIRELIQNALDANYLEGLKAQKNGRPYKPRIVVSYVLDEDEQLSAIRVDDNGDGMSLAEVKDTLLWVGQSRSSKESVRELLSETGTELISNFGIGLLTCFRVARTMKISTQKGADGNPFEISIFGLGEKIESQKLPQSVSGTSVLLELKDGSEIDYLEETLKEYCRQVTSSPIYLQEVTSDQILCLDRADILTLSEEEGFLLDQYEPSDNAITVEGDRFFASFNAPWGTDTNDLIYGQGETAVLNNGLYVYTRKTSDWLPEELGFLDGVINLSAKSVNLQASRDSIVEDHLLESAKERVAEKRYQILREISRMSRTESLRSDSAIILASCCKNRSKFERDKLRREVGDQRVRIFGGGTISLDELSTSNAHSIFLYYQAGRWVENLTKFDETQLYYKRNSINELQAKVLQKRGEIVLDLSVAQSEQRSSEVKEAALIAWYFSGTDKKIVDLTSDKSSAIEWRSRPVPKEIRARIGSRVKFVEVGISPEKIGWDLKNEIWINLSNPAVRRAFQAIKRENFPKEKLVFLDMLISMVDSEFDAVTNSLLENIGS